MLAAGKSSRAAFRSVYADEAPPEATRKVGGRLVTRAFSPPDPDKIPDVDRRLGPVFLDPDDLASPSLSPEEVLLQSDDAAEARQAMEAALLSSQLTPQEQQLLCEYVEACWSGYRPGGKKGNSLRQLWGDRYEAKRKALQRIKKRRPGTAEWLDRVCALA